MPCAQIYAKARPTALALLGGILLSGCTQLTIPPWNGPRLIAPRTQLTLDNLQAGTILPLLDMSFFARPDWALAATTPFSGSLSFKETHMDYPLERSHYAGEALFPAFRAGFISHAGELIPLERDLVRTGKDSDSMWDVLLGAGRVWHEAEDGDWNRASFPLSLTDRFIGQVRNCVASFAYTPSSVSQVYLQCSQETADANDGRLGNIRAMLSADYQPANQPDAQPDAQPDTQPDTAAVIAEHTAFKQKRLPVQPLGAIDPKAEIAAVFSQSLQTNASTSLGAVLRDGKVYLHPPQTRHGLYPYPQEMRHGLYSVTKSMAGALALFYFAERYGPEIFDAQISDYVPALAKHPGWQGVSFSDTLNMVTGTAGGEGPDQLLNVIVTANTAEECITNIAGLGDAPAAPGEKFNYASTNLFVLSYALQNYVAQAEGKPQNYWDLVRAHVLKPIGAEHFNLQHTQETDGSLGIPFLAYGATPTLDEAAKLTRLFSNEGAFEGKQLLNRQRVREALGRTGWSGYSTDNDSRGPTYRHGFWASTVQTPACKVPVTYMLGHGANYVLFLPSGTQILRFMDEGDFDYPALVRSVEQIAPSCP